MSTPKYKETGLEKFRRLGAIKPHIYWCSMLGEWIYAMNGKNDKVCQFCIDQDTRWTPRNHK